MSNGYGRSAQFPITAEQSVRLIVRTCLDEGVTDTRQIAYVLATAQHETGGFRSPEEGSGRLQAVRIGYQGGEDYFGRGYVHLTHDENYRTLGAALGMGERLYDEPTRAIEPEIAARVLVVGMRDGHFAAAQTLDRYIAGDNADYVRARRIVNGNDRSGHVAGLARAWEPRIADLVDEVRRNGVDLTPVATPRDPDAPLQRGDANARVFELQQYLAVLGATGRAGQPLAPDGDFGPSTQQAVQHYQARTGIVPPVATVDEALFTRIRDEALLADPQFRLKTIDDLYGPLNDGVLGPEERGDAVEDLQQQLRGLGYLAHDGSSLGVSRMYNQATLDAVSSFQLDAGIPENGLADVLTRDALNARAVEQGLDEAAEVRRRREEAEAELLNSPHGTRSRGLPAGNPQDVLGELDRAMLDQLRSQVRVLDRQAGKEWDDSSERLAASALAMARAHGFTAESRLLLGLNSPTPEAEGGTILHLLRTGAGASNDPASNHVQMAISKALSMPVDERFERILAVSELQSSRERYSPDAALACSPMPTELQSPANAHG